jgi:uncharacterized protein
MNRGIWKSGNRGIGLAIASLLALSVGCTSGPAPVGAQPYEAQIVSFRTGKDKAFKSGSDSPIPAAQRATFSGLAYYSVTSTYRVPSLFTEERSGPPLIMELDTSIGRRDRFRRVGFLTFTLGESSYRLTAFADVNAKTVDRLFVPFGDLTNGNETYGGGRYLELNRTVTGLYDLDFNRAYHPFCVYNHEYECPVPPSENRLPVAVRAGERLR